MMYYFRRTRDNSKQPVKTKLWGKKTLKSEVCEKHFNDVSILSKIGQAFGFIATDRFKH